MGDDIEALAQARDAYARHDFAAAVGAFEEADSVDGLGAADLQTFADALWWSGDSDGAVAALERAFAAYQKAGSRAEAAAIAIRLCHIAMRRLAFAIAGGWMAKAERLLADEPEGWAHAWLTLTRMFFVIYKDNDLEGGLAVADRTLEIARAHGNGDAESLTLSVKGQVLVRMGRWQEGLALVDEATSAAVSGALGPHAACEVYCFTISTCRNLFDYARAGEWTEEADRFMERNALGGYRGTCRAHRAEIKRLRGHYAEAEQEARAACAELEAFHLLDGVGFAYYEVGEARLRMGDLESAEEAFRRAHEYGRNPQPGWALMLLIQGKVEEAAAAIDRSLSGALGPLEGGRPRHDLLGRSRLLPAQVEVALAAGDLATARTAVEELEELSRGYESAIVEAAATWARGALQHAERDPAATETLERAWRLYQRLTMPYESARARLLLGLAHAAAGDSGSAEMELRAAKRAFEALGAALDARRASDALRTHAPPKEAPERVSKTFMFTDIVASTDLVRLMGDEKWERLIAWHDRELRAKVAEHKGEIVRHTGDGFFVTFDRAAAALACAIAIQRRLAEARDAQGFAPSVRIGLHAADAGRHGDDYAGHGVHVAARVGTIAGSDEIVASRDTAEESGAASHMLRDLRTVTLKGVAEPIEVLTIAWE